MAEKHIKVYPNGATLIYYRQNLNSTTDVTMGFVSGARRDGTKKGLAHALEHSLFNGIDGMTKDEMRKVIQNERRIELAFEEHRFYDIRRWRIAEEVFAKPLQGMNITVGSGQTVYTRVDLMTTKFSAKDYLYPIPYSEVIKNKNMKQNPNW